MAIRQGLWKYLDHRGSRGNNYDSPAMKLFALPDAVPDVPGQLYNLKDDPGKTRSLYFQHPEVVRELKTLLEKAKTDGAQRSDAESLESAGRNSAIAIGFALAR